MCCPSLWLHLSAFLFLLRICVYFFYLQKSQGLQLYFYLTILQFGPEGPDQAGPVVAVSQVGALLILLEETRYNKHILSITRYLI